MIYFNCGTCGFPLTNCGDDIITCPICGTRYNPICIRAKFGGNVVLRLEGDKKRNIELEHDCSTVCHRYDDKIELHKRRKR